MFDLRQGTDGKFYVLEINARYWGSLIGSLSAGVNFPAIACALALGEPVEPVEVKYDRYGVGLLTFKGAPCSGSCRYSSSKYTVAVHDERSSTRRGGNRIATGTKPARQDSKEVVYDCGLGLTMTMPVHLDKFGDSARRLFPIRINWLF